MFLARVVIGEYCRGVQNALAPPVNLTRTLARPFLDPNRNPNPTHSPTSSPNPSHSPNPNPNPNPNQARDGAVLFDSTVDDVRNPRIFVTYRDSQAYPDYLVQFRQ